MGYLINNATFEPPSILVLLQILSGKTKATELLLQGNVYLLPPNKVVELSVPAIHAIGGAASVLLFRFISNADLHFQSIPYTFTE